MGLAPGTRLGQYEILAPVGAGGMGEVYRARDSRLGRDVAIKVLRGGVAADPHRLPRFEREARLLASLNHPGIAAVYGFEDPGGETPFIVMELVPGKTLSERLFAAGLPVSEALELARQIADALESAHEQGVIHRDLKPGNIKVTPDGKVKVLDLGLAKAFDVKSVSSDDMSQSPTIGLEQTRPGVILGTAEFMSPEQARGKSVDKRTDIWAFGCILYEMLSGRRAFTGETTSDVLAAILSAEPDWKALPPDTPPRVRELLQRCLQKDPNRRLRDIGEARILIAEALGEAASGISHPPGVQAAAAGSRSVRRLAAGIVALAVAVLAVWLTRQRAREGAAPIPKDKYLAVMPFKDLSGSPDGRLVGDALMDTLSVRLNRVPGIQVVSSSQVLAISQTQSDPFQAARSVGANLFIQSAFQRDRDRMRISYAVWNVQARRRIGGDIVDGLASDFFEMQDQLAENVASSLNLPSGTEGKTPRQELSTAEAQDRYLGAIGHLQRFEREPSVDAAEALLSRLAAEWPDSALVQAALARAHLYKFELTKDRSWGEQALTASQRALTLDPNLPEALITLGQIQNRTGRHSEAKTTFQGIIRRQPNNAAALVGLALAHEGLGDLKEAEKLYRLALERQSAYWGSYDRLGGFYFAHGQYAKAVEMFRRVVELAPDSARGYSSMGAAYQVLDRFEEARQAYRKSIEVEPSSSAYSNLGVLEYSRGNFDAAAKAFEEAVRLKPRDYLYWLNLADALRWSKEGSRAPGAYQRAIGLAREELEVNPRSARAHMALALAYAKLGQLDLSQKHLKEARSINPKDPAQYYQGAVIANLAGDSEEALRNIREARKAGYGAGEFVNEPELANLRRDKRFQEALRGP